MTSILFGTLGLSIAMVAAIVLACARDGTAASHVSPIRRTAGMAVLLHLGHFIEEHTGGFYERFPEILGLAPWSREFFVNFNAVGLAVWLLSIMTLRRLPRVSAVPLWFLAITSMANGLVHPILSVYGSGYFPGFWTSLLVGIVGIVLFRSLMSATHARRNDIRPDDSA